MLLASSHEYPDCVSCRDLSFYSSVYSFRYRHFNALTLCQFICRFSCRIRACAGGRRTVSHKAAGHSVYAAAGQFSNVTIKIFI